MRWLSPIRVAFKTMWKWCNFRNNETLRILVLCSCRRYAWICTQRDMYDAYVFATKYVNAEAQNTISYAKMMNIVFSASALSYFATKTSASYISRCVDIQAYLRHRQRTSIRKVSLFQKLHHCLIVLRRRTSATPNARVAIGPTCTFIFYLLRLLYLHAR